MKFVTLSVCMKDQLTWCVDALCGVSMLCVVCRCSVWCACEFEGTRRRVMVSKENSETLKNTLGPFTV